MHYNVCWGRIMGISSLSCLTKSGFLVPFCIWIGSLAFVAMLRIIYGF